MPSLKPSISSSWNSLRPSAVGGSLHGRPMAGMPDFSQLLQLGQQMQGRLSRMQTELADQTVTGSAGGGMVTVTADGRGRVRSVKIDPAAISGGDVELVEDMVLAAVADAQRRADELYADELRKVTGGIPLPFPLPF